MSPRPSFDPGFSTPALAAIYTPDSTVGAMLEFEAALALALADTGIAPREDAEAMAAACWEGVADAEAVLDSTWETGTPVIALREAVGAGDWFHHGATSQDAVDSAQMLQAARALDVIDELLTSIAGRLRDLTIDHRDLPQMGRTFLQDARPTTFGFRTALWLDAALAHVEDLRAQRAALPVQLGGPVGTGDVYGETVTQVRESLAQRLGLRAPVISWHSDRTPVLEVAQAVDRSTRTMARIGTDVALLASSSINEISVRSGGSSSMEGKRNPIDSIRAVAAAAACGGALAMLTSAPPHQLDRGVGPWHVEWLALPLLFQTAGAAADSIATCLASLEVNAERMSGSVEAAAPIGQIDQVLERFDDLLRS